MRIGIALLWGYCTQPHPIALGVLKPQLPVYDKPIIYQLISVLILDRIRIILIICTPQDLAGFRNLLGGGE